ncbi:MAG: diphthine--ammonia ligase [Candidatus Omnitrophota bacterium]|nr:MAG: diphthine--ammonia ligase [Candidatus Omnitrophota bacterium]
MVEKALFTWSGGKDSAMALYELKKNHDYEILALLTTVTDDYRRVSMHGVRNILLEQQAKSLGLHLDKIYITKNSSDQDYKARMKEKLIYYRNQGILSVVFGDIFLEGPRRYREENLSRIDMKAIFPIWKRDTTKLAQAFIDLRFKAIITCVDSRVLDKTFIGRIFDEQLLSELPSTVDPCGENGEFHSFVYEGPIFKNRISYTVGEVILRDNRFYYCDLLPAKKDKVYSAR